MDGAATHCANCDAALAGEQRFCGACGQRTGRQRLTMHDISHDFLHAMFHIDQSIVALIKALAYRPGHVAREYVEGRRKKYFGPFAFLLLTVGLASFMIVVTGVKWVTSDVDNASVEFLQRHVNIAILLQTPLLAGACALLFYKQRLNYAEHLVLAAYTSGFRILVLALVVVPVLLLTKVKFSDQVFVGPYFGLWLVYFVIAALQFYRGSAPWIVVRAVLATVIGQLLTVTLLSLFVALFITLTTH